jgi:hypothetical protein
MIVRTCIQKKRMMAGRLRFIHVRREKEEMYTERFKLNDTTMLHCTSCHVYDIYFLVVRNCMSQNILYSS